MKHTPLNTETRAAIHRLKEAGCPLDDRYLHAHTDPIRVNLEPSEIGAHLLRFDGDTLLALPLRIVARCRVTVCRFSLSADWLLAPVVWLEACRQHSNYYCFAAHRARFASGFVLNHRTYAKGVIASGGFLRGLLLAALPLAITELPASAHTTVWIEDLLANTYPFSITIENHGVGLMTEVAVAGDTATTEFTLAN